MKSKFTIKSAPLTFRADADVAARIRREQSIGMKLTAIVNRALRLFFKLKP